MKKSKLILINTLISTLLTRVPQAFAQGGGLPTTKGISNPVVEGALGKGVAEAQSGATFLSYFVMLWRAFITLGALAVIIMFLWGAFEWITAGGDSSKVGKARDKITQAVIGLILMVGSFVIIAYVGQVFFGESFDILNLTLPTPESI